MRKKQFHTATTITDRYCFYYCHRDYYDACNCNCLSSSNSSSNSNSTPIIINQQRPPQKRQRQRRQRRYHYHRNKRYNTIILRLLVVVVVLTTTVFTITITITGVAGEGDAVDQDVDAVNALIKNTIERKKKKTSNNDNKNKILSLLLGRRTIQKKKKQALLIGGNGDEDYNKKRIEETLKKFYKLTDPRFAKTVSSIVGVADTAINHEESKQHNLLLLPSSNGIDIMKDEDEDDDDEKQDSENVDDDNDDVVMLPGTVLEVFRTPLHQRRDDDDQDEDVDVDDQDEDCDNNEDRHSNTNSQRNHHHSKLPMSDYHHFLVDEENTIECDSRYMLCEPIHLELGNAPNHYMDFAYTSVLQSSSISASSTTTTTTTTSSTSNSKSASSLTSTPSSLLEVESSSSIITDDATTTLSLLFEKDNVAIELIEDEKVVKDDQESTCKDIVSTTTVTTTTNNENENENNNMNNQNQHEHEHQNQHHYEKKQNSNNYYKDNRTEMSFFSAWWNWWLPFTNSDWWKAKGSTQSDYDMNTGAFAGGSNGEVWKGHRVCSSSSSKKECDDQTQLVLKRLRVERGYLLLEAGLREVYFGKLIQTQLDKNQQNNMYTVYVDHFFREVPKQRIMKKAFGVGAGLQQQQQGNDLELWIVYEDAGPSLRSYLYTPTVTDGGFIMYQHSKLWTQLRTFTNDEEQASYHASSSSASASALQVQNLDDHSYDEPPEPLFTSSSKNNSKKKKKRKKKKRTDNNKRILHIGRLFMQNTLREILSAAAELHKRGIVHRDIKPSNVMCKSNVPIDDYIHSYEEFEFDDDDDDDDDNDDDSSSLPNMHCRLGDFSSGWDQYTNEHLYTKGPTPDEQTNEYAPPESFVGPNWVPFYKDKPQSYDSWSIGVLALELLLGTPNVFSVDQRTNALLTYKMKRANASENEISNALYLAALSNFCIYIPSNDTSNKPQSWPLRHGDPLHKTSMVKESCTLQDFHRALRARDPLGIGFDSSTDLLLHLIWQLLAFDPEERMTAEEALQHPYFISPDGTLDSLNEIPGFHNALESQMLDPRIDFNVVDDIKDFVCPKCGRVFHDWESCHRHSNIRKHSKFCTYNHTYLPSCINTHMMLPEHPTSGYCDLQGRRPTIEDFHSIHLKHDHQFYGMFDGHTGNLASKFAASELYGELMRRLPNLENMLTTSKSEGEGVIGDEKYSWKEDIRLNVTQAFEYVHDQFLDRITTMTSPIVEVGTAPNMDQSGTTATAILVTDNMIIAATLGDSRAVISSSPSTAKSKENSDSSRSSSSHSSRNPWKDFPSVSAVQFSIDHVASHPTERDLVIERGGFVSASGGIPRVNGILAVTRSIGDADLAPVLSREPHVLVLDRSEIRELCGSLGRSSNNSSEQDNNGHTIPCFVILASDGLWDVMSNQEAVDMVVDIILRENIKMYDGIDARERERTMFPPSSDDNHSNKNDIDIYYNDHEAADGPFQEAAERLAVEAYVRGSTDNIGVCVVAVD